MLLPLQMPSPSGTRHLVGCLLTTSPQRAQAKCRSRLPGPQNRASRVRFSSADRPENCRVRLSPAIAAKRPALFRCADSGKVPFTFSDQRSVAEDGIFPSRASWKIAVLSLRNVALSDR